MKRDDTPLTLPATKADLAAFERRMTRWMVLGTLLFAVYAVALKLIG
jgi:hypothetical protein